MGLSHGHSSDEAVTVTITVDDPTVISVSPLSYTFEPSTDLERLNLAINCLEDNVLNTAGSERYTRRETTIRFTSSSDTAHWDGLTATTVVDNYDNEPYQAALAEGETYERPLAVVFFTANDITVTATSSNPDVVSVSPAMHTWAAADRTSAISAEKSYTLTAVDDGIYRGEQTATISFSQPHAENFYVQSVEVTVTDNDKPPLVISPDPLSVTEGGQATYTVKLGAEPTTGVTVAIGGAADTDLTLDKASLTFTTSNWNTAQTVTVTASDDDDGANDTATLTHTASGGIYDGVTADLGVTVTDDDERQVVLSRQSLSIDEDDDATYTVKLSTEPTTAVIVTITGHAGSDLTLDKTELTFTTSTWSTAQTITVEAGGDDDAENDTATLVHTAAGGDYAGLASSLEVTTNDDDTKTFQDGDGTLGDSTLTVAEGGSSTHSVRLSSEPTDTVTVTITGHAGTDLSLNTASLTFTTANWNTAQTVTVSADQDDDAVNDEVTLTLTGAGGNYAGVTADLVVTVTDDDEVGLVFDPDTVTVAEGGSSSYTVKLASEPTAQVTVAITGDEDTDLTLGADSLAFDASTWNTAQTVTVAAGQDTDGTNDTATLTHEASGGDYTGVSGTVTVNTTDDETPPTAITLTANPDSVAENGGAETVTVTAEIDGSVVFTEARTVTVSVADDTAASPADYAVVANFDIAIAAGAASGTGSFTLKPVDDAVVESTETIDVTGTSDGLAVTGDEISITDNDATLGLVIAPYPLYLDEGESAPYTVRLASEPTGNVTVYISGVLDEVLTLDKSRLTFTPANWRQTQTVTVTGTHDEDGITDVATLDHTASGGGYDSVSQQLGVIILDDDTPGIVIAPDSLGVDEGDQATYTVKLATKPSSTVTVAIAGHADTDLSLDNDSLEFTTETWNTAQTVTVAAGHDDDAENDTATLTHTASGGTYGGQAADLPVTVTDDETAPTAVTLTASPDSVTEGDGATAVTVTAEIDGAARFTEATTVAVSVRDGTATAPDDYAAVSDFDIVIAAGEASGGGAFTLTPVDDAADEPAETIEVAGTAAGLAVAGDEISITDNDDPPPPPPPNSPPAVSARCDPCAVPRGGEVGLTALAADPDGDALEYEWSAPSGAFAGGSGGRHARWTAPHELGSVDIRVEVSDGSGGAASATATVEVVNRGPSFGQPVYRFTLQENLDGVRRPVDLGRLAASDPDGDALSYELVSGDGTRFEVNARDGMVRYVGPGEDYEAEPRQYESSVRVRDAPGAEADARVVVMIAGMNEQPAAADDEVQTNEDEAVAVNVLANDSDLDGDPLHIAGVAAPAHGTAAVAADGGVIYVPAENFHGMDRFTYIASDGDGLMDSATVTVTVSPVNDAPAAVGTMPEQALDEGGNPVSLDLSPYFSDVDGGALSYRAESSDTDVVTVAVLGSQLTLTPVVYGTAAVSVTAEDPGGLTATQTFAAGVDDRPVRGALGNALSAMARSHLSSARMTLGRRAASGVGERSVLTVAGRRVPLDKAGWRRIVDRVAAGVPNGSAGSTSGLRGHPSGEFGVTAFGQPMAGESPPGASGLPNGFGSFGVLGILGSLSGVSDASLGDLEFEWVPGVDDAATEGDADSEPAGRRWAVWGQGDFQTFEGAPSVLGYDAGHDGDLRTAWLGVDTELSDRWLSGVAVARGVGAADWRVGASSGRLATELTSLQPYLRWSGGAASVWAMFGGGWGTAENVRDATGLAGTADLGLRMGLVEYRRRFGGDSGKVRFALRADAAWAGLETGDGAESVDRLSAAVGRQRLGAEISGPVRVGGGTVELFGEAHLRRDGGDGQAGSGVEVALGLRVRQGNVRIDAQGRALAVHSAAGYRERGAGVTFTLGEPDALGLSLSVSPRWGNVAPAGTGALWREEIDRLRHPGTAPDMWSLEANLRYGKRFSGGGVLVWFGGYDQSHGRSRFRIGLCCCSSN